MSEIRINQIKGIQQYKCDKNGKCEEKQEKEQVTEKAQVVKKDGKEVLEYMAQSGALNKNQIKKSEIDVNKHVDKASEARIEKMMKAFDDTILKSAEMAIEEFGLSEAAGQDVAIMAFNQRFLV